MDSYLITADGAEQQPTTDTVRRLLDSHASFWIDLTNPGQQGTSLLRDTFGFHPLAVEDAEHFRQRPKAETYDDFTVMVIYGAGRNRRLIETHCFYTEHYLVTVHREPCPELRELADRFTQHAERWPGIAMLLYRVADGLVDGFFPVLSGLDDQIDDIEDEILGRPTDEQLGRLFEMKRSLIAMRKVVTPQRDMLAELLSDPDRLPGAGTEAEHYFRDLYDHLIRISDLIDSYRDLISGALDTHISTVSNRLNVVMKQLTIIATIFLPLSFLTGFLGQNFSWMVAGITSMPAFLGLGVGLQIVVVITLLAFFRRRGWLSSDGIVPGVSQAKRRRVASEDRWHVLHPSPAAFE